MIARQYNIKISETWDPCVFNIFWNKKFFYDALEEDWPLNKIILVNWAFSTNGPFTIKASMEGQKGCNILSLINCRSAVTATANKIAAMVFRRWVIGSIAFKDYPTGNGDSYSILEFL